MDSTKTLLADIEAFLVRSGLSATDFGVMIRNDTKLLTSLRDGGTVSLRTADRIREFMRTYPKRQREMA